MATARLRLLGQFQRYSCCHENGDGLASEAYWKNIENDVVFDEIKYRDILYLRSKSGPCLPSKKNFFQQTEKIYDTPDYHFGGVPTVSRTWTKVPLPCGSSIGTDWMGSIL